MTDEDDQKSSLAELLLAKSRRLRPCQTLVTRTDGSCRLEARDRSGNFTAVTLQELSGSGKQEANITDEKNRGAMIHQGGGQSSMILNSEGNRVGPSLMAKCPGFVVDTKPDLLCCMVLPHLLLAGQDVAHDVTILKKFGVTAVLSLLPHEGSEEGNVWMLTEDGTLVKSDRHCSKESSEQASTSNEALSLLPHDGSEEGNVWMLVEDGNLVKSPRHCSKDSRELASTSNETATVPASLGPKKPGDFSDLRFTRNEDEFSTSSILRVHCGLLDTPESRIHACLLKCIAFIDQVKRRNGVVLVHCNAGVSRAPTVVIAYCMKFLRISYSEALKFVKEKRPYIKPNEGFVEQLKEFEQYLLAL
ncbi:uncharacterized protein LOC108677353 [Hyalella azteca]|uniref:Uncharacterized protein LOC108677353 n=1 Tax=Hyalella azteca TaxID=294128 RepID=A0A8B7P531_HYAAZ|nr:uncharacterized protein LOC108677353 [Hyalella azteca]